MKKYFIISFALLGLFLLPKFSLAASIFNFSSGTDVVPVYSGNYLLGSPLGHPLINTLSGGGQWSLDMHCAASGACSPNTQIELYECSDSSYSSCSAKYDFGVFNLSSVAGSFVASGTVSGFVLDVSKWYELEVYDNNGASNANAILASSGSYVPLPRYPSFSTGFWSGNPNLCVADSLSECASAPAGPTASFAFVYPTSTQIVAPFDAYLLSAVAENVSSTDLCLVTLQDELVGITSYRILPPAVDTCGNMAVNAILVPRPSFGKVFSNGVTSSVVSAVASFYREPTVEDPVSRLLSTAHIAYTLLANGTIAGATTTLNIIMPNVTTSTWNGSFNVSSTINFSVVITGGSTSTLALNCGEAPNILDVGGGLSWAGCSLVNLVFLPNSDVTNLFFDSLNSFKTVFPFSLYFNVVGGVQNALIATSTADYSLPLQFRGLHGDTVTMITLTSSTLVNALVNPTCDIACVRADVDNVMNPVRMGIWIVAGLKIISMIVL